MRVKAVELVGDAQAQLAAAKAATEQALAAAGIKNQRKRENMLLDVFL